MKRPYRVIVWGPGNLGNACIREILRLPDFELAGVLGYSEKKAGQDIGTLLGLPPANVKVTLDKEEILRMPADCVIHTAAPPFDKDAMDQDVLRLLESGKNVISSTAFFYPLFHGQTYVDKFEAACRKGGVSLHGSGEHPGFMMERLGMTVSALTGSVERIKADEIVYVGKVPAATLKDYGFGVTPEEALNGPVTAILKRWLYVETVTFACVALFGRQPDRVDHEPIFEAADDDVVADAITIRKGTSRVVRHVFSAVLDGKPRVIFEHYWYVMPEDAPFENENGTDKWKVEIEGKPVSLRLTLDAMASLDRNEVMHPGDPTIPTYYATASVLLQAVPVVCAAAPGIVFPTTFTNSVESYHRLATRKTLVT